MSATVIELTFEHLSRRGVIEARYGTNTSAVRSGFDALQSLGFDPALCLGYPTLSARVKRYAGSGYRSMLAWIQVVTSTRYAHLSDAVPSQVSHDVDASPHMLAQGVPFFAYGYPAALYDAPCNNLGDAARLDWLAHTFLVTFPSRLNGDTIACLSAFSWGYTEWDDNGRRHVTLTPAKPETASAWHNTLPLLRSNCPRLNFV